MVFILQPFDDASSILRPSVQTERTAIVKLNLYSASRSFRFELQRKDGPGAAPFITIAIISGLQFSIFKRRYTFIDLDFPGGTNFFQYRGRHVRSDAIPSPWSTPVTAIAQLIDTSVGEEANRIDEDSIEGEGSLKWSNYGPPSGDAEGFL